MTFLSPLAFALLGLTLPLVLLYFLKVRRRERRVSSLLLWETLLRDREASADPRLDLATSPGPLRLPGQPPLSPFAFELALAVAPRSHARSLLTH